MPHQEIGRIDPEQQPQAQLRFSEYELQVLESITKHAIDARALSSELVDVVAGVQRKVTDGRAQVALARRRLASERANAAREGSDDDQTSAPE